MKTLVIHPLDPSTLFLATIYKGRDWTIIDDGASKKELTRQIKEHNRIIMLGHGTEYGLVTPSANILVGSKLVYLLREKKCVCIWCDADVFVTKYKLSGFFTGMIISDYMEANMFCVDATSQEIEESNKLFADSIKKSIDSEDMLSEIKKHYIGNTAIIEFNKNHLYEI